MNKEEIMAMEAGRELDIVVAKLMGANMKLFEFAYEAVNYNYSTDISAAWEVIVLFKEQMLFSKRDKFFKELRGLLKTKDGYFIDWPSALMFLEPQHICKAALLAVMDS